MTNVMYKGDPVREMWQPQSMKILIHSTIPLTSVLACIVPKTLALTALGLHIYPADIHTHAFSNIQQCISSVACNSARSQQIVPALASFTE